jgi:hypothetical protein
LKTTKKTKEYLREVIIKCLLVLCQPSITRLLERGNTPWFQWIGTICPNPMTIRQKISMLFIEASRSKSKCIMDTPRMTKRVVDNQEVVGQNDCLELN